MDPRRREDDTQYPSSPPSLVIPGNDRESMPLPVIPGHDRESMDPRFRGDDRKLLQPWLSKQHQ